MIPRIDDLCNTRVTPALPCSPNNLTLVILLQRQQVHPPRPPTPRILPISLTLKLAARPPPTTLGILIPKPIPTLTPTPTRLLPHDHRSNHRSSSSSNSSLHDRSRAPRRCSTSSHREGRLSTAVRPRADQAQGARHRMLASRRKCPGEKDGRCRRRRPYLGVWWPRNLSKPSRRPQAAPTDYQARAGVVGAPDWVWDSAAWAAWEGTSSSMATTRKLSLVLGLLQLGHLYPRLVLDPELGWEWEQEQEQEQELIPDWADSPTVQINHRLLPGLHRPQRLQRGTRDPHRPQPQLQRGDMAWPITSAVHRPEHSDRSPQDWARSAC